MGARKFSFKRRFMRRLSGAGVIASLSLAVVAAYWSLWFEGEARSASTAMFAAPALAFVAFFLGRKTETIARRRTRDVLELAPHLSECVGTGALLRRYFLHSCERRLREASAGHGFAFFALDMDYLKTINDSLGHEVGDAALRHLVDSIRLSTGSRTVIGRLGGDEFAFLTDCASQEEAQATAARLQAQFGRSTPIASRQLTLSVTIGIVLLPRHTSLLPEALQLADIALYAGKNAGRSRSTVFQPAMLRQLRRDRTIEKDLRLALERGELRQLYRPTVCTKGRIAGARSVVQWSGQRAGTIPYETFVRIAERTDLVDRLGEWSLRQACRDALLFDDTTPVGVVVRASQMRRDRIVESVASVLRETGIEPQRLALLLGDAAEWTRDVNVERRLRALRALGVRVSVDDVGAILCSVEQASDLPVDSLRIRPDRVSQLGRSEQENIIVESLTRTGKAMSLLVVADGVETAEQLRLARLAGCDRFAGPFIADAMSVDAITRRIAANRAKP